MDKVNRYRVYFTGYEHPRVKSGFKIVDVVEKRKYAYVSLISKKIKLPITVWEQMKKSAKEIENV